MPERLGTANASRMRSASSRPQRRPTRRGFVDVKESTSGVRAGARKAPRGRGKNLGPIEEKLWVTIMSGSASAQDGISDRERQALNNTQHELTTCWAYYMLVRQCVLNRAKPSEDARLIQNLNTSADRLLEHAHSIGTAIGMTLDAMSSRGHNELMTMKTLVNNDCINISSPLRRYGLRCKQVVENPDSIFSEYVKQR